MIFLLNSGTITILNKKAFPNSQGGTCAFIAGFINQLMDKQVPFGLIGNFSVDDDRISHYTFNTSSNLGFLVKLGLFFLSKRSAKFDILYFNRPDHLSLSWRSSSLKVLHLHGQPYTTINNGKNFYKKLIYNILEPIAMRKANLIIATDKLTAGLYSSLYPRLKSRIKIIPTGINLSEFNPDSTFDPFPGVEENTFNFAFIGRMAYPKQVREIINAFVLAFAGNSSAHLWIAGSGPDEIGLKKIAAKSDCHANIHFTGQLSQYDVVRLIHSSNVGILLSHNEGSPVVIKEFLSCGKPVIVNNVGDLSDYVFHGKNGYIINAQQIESVANAMNDMALNAHLMKVASRESMLPYDNKLIYQQVLDELMTTQFIT